MKISAVRATPVAVTDPPLLNATGIHQPYALRTIIEVTTDEGLTGIGETYGHARMLCELADIEEALLGADPFHLNAIDRAIVTRRSAKRLAPHERARLNAMLLASIEIPCLDIQGKALGRPVADLLGGRLRDHVPFAAYLFFKYAEHIDFDEYEPDAFGEVLTPEAMVDEARTLVDRYGFASLKLKGGALDPSTDVATIHALGQAFPDHPLRIDPNAAWSVDTCMRVDRELRGALQYLEDPTVGVAGMASVATQTSVPLATNMIVTGFTDLPAAVQHRACQIVLADHHYWGGLRRSRELARLCATFGLQLGMHSNSHLGISLAAMVHFGATVDDLPYAYDTHQPWQAEDEVIRGGKLKIVDGAVRVPDGPGLGVELDHDALAMLNERYQRCGIRSRDDVGQMRRYDPDWTGIVPRF